MVYYPNYRNNTVIGAKPVTVSSGSGSTLARKAGTKYSKKLNNTKGNFSLNGTNNNNYIGNPNSALSYTACKLPNNTPSVSVKNYSGYLKTRIVNNEVKCSVNNSFDCYKKVNAALIGANLNKHNLYSRDQSQQLDITKNKCSIDRSNYSQELKDKPLCLGTKDRLKCNITKDLTHVANGFTPGYGLYYNDSTLFKKKCLHLNNYPDARNIAC